MYEYQYRPFLYLLELEIVFLLACNILIVARRVYFYFTKNRSKRRQKILSHLILEFLKRQRLVHPIPKSTRWLQDLIVVLESFDRNFSDENWFAIKRLCVTDHLLPLARKWAKSSRWKLRLAAAKSFSMVPKKEDRDPILALLLDKSFAISSYAAKAVIGIENEEGLKIILKQCSHHQSFTACFYKDLFAKSSKRVHEILVRMGANLEVQKTLLYILSKQPLDFSLPFLDHALMSKDGETRKIALKFFGNHMDHFSYSKVLPFLEDPYSAVRLEAIQIIQHFINPEILGKLIAILQSEDTFEVRMAAAYAIKKIGREDLLKNQEEERANNIVTYILEFG